MLVLAIDSKRILDQIVRTYAEKAHFPRKEIGDQGCRRDLDHHPERDVLIERLSFRSGFAFISSMIFLVSYELGQTRDHGNKDLDVPVGRGPSIPLSCVVKISRC